MPLRPPLHGIDRRPELHLRCPVERLSREGIAARLCGFPLHLEGAVIDAGRLSDAEMLRTFNCGIGMVAVVAKDGADALVRLMQEWGESPVIIGEVTPPGGEKSSAKGKGEAWAVGYEGVLKCQ